ncbi:MAG: NUDIX domain-containing protein [Pseudonocardiaceae bacterium]
MQTLSTRQVYTNAWMSVREDRVRRGDGSSGIYSVVDKPDYALIIPLDDDRVHLVEQYRYPVAARRWEFPAGTAPDRPDIEPAALAARELREETGLVAGRLHLLGVLDVAPGMSAQRGRVFLATDIVAGHAEREHTEQDMHSAWFTLADLDGMLRSGEVCDAQSVAAYALFRLHERTG